MNKPEQLRLAAKIIEKGLEWEVRCVDATCNLIVCKQWHKPDQSMLAVLSAKLETEIRIKPTAPKPKKIPLGPEDVPPGSVIRGNLGDQPTQAWCGVLGAFSDIIKVMGAPSDYKKYTYQELMSLNLQISRDFGKTWHPCEKDEPQQSAPVQQKTTPSA